jgi:short-subunit dehydrogenase
VQCLADVLPWREMPAGGTLAAVTTTRISLERHFRAHAPWRTGIVAADCGPQIIAHLHGACAAGARVRLTLRLDQAGRGAVFAMPEHTVPHEEDDPQLRAFNADPRQRRVLIADGRAATTPALAKALLAAGAARLYLGVAETWKPQDAVIAGADIEPVPLDLTNSPSVAELAARMGDKVDIVVNNAAHVRPGGVIGGQDPVRARETFETNCLGLMRLAAAFGPAMRARAAEPGRSAAAFVTILSAWSLAAAPEFGAYAASQSAARALSQVVRAELRPAGIRVVDVLTGPIDDEWHQALRPPKVTPAAIAVAIVTGLREGREEIVVGDLAREIHAKWAADPRLLARESV